MPNSFPTANRSDAPTVTLPSVGIIGAGAMGESLLYGLTRPGVAIAGEVRATCYSAARAAHLRERLGRTVDAVEEYPEANIRTAEASDVIVLAISPDRVPSVLNDISSSLRPNALVISMAAGITLERLTNMLPESATAVRVIPNLGGQVGFGLTGVGQNESISEEQLRLVNALFATVGRIVTVRDDQLDAVSSLSGTGPAYFYYFTEQFRSAAVELGFSPDQARQLAEQTFVGAAAVMQDSGEAPSELLRYFSNPAGTSIRAINEMANHDLKGMLVKAASATMVRSKEIAQEAETNDHNSV